MYNAKDEMSTEIGIHPNGAVRFDPGLILKKPLQFLVFGVPDIGEISRENGTNTLLGGDISKGTLNLSCEDFKV